MKKLLCLLLAIFTVLSCCFPVFAETTLKITEQPESVSVKEGERAVVSLKAEGDDLTYKWYFKNPGATKFSYTDTFKGSTYTISSMTASRDGRQIYCVVSDKYGNTVKSDTVSLNIKGIKIVTQPSDVTALSGSIAKTSVKAQGDGLKYQWYFANKGKTKFSKASITSATYSCPMDKTRDGRRIYCVITDKYGNTKKTNTVTLDMISMAGKNSVCIPGTGMNHKFTIGKFNQAAIDSNNIVYTTDNGKNDPFILGHKTGTMGKLSKTKVGQYIYVSVNGKVETYKVVVSEYALQNSSWTDIIGRTTGTSVWDNYGTKTLHMYTCYGSNKNGRWLVLAKKV